MMSDKEIKKLYKPKFWAEPDKYYATQVLKEEGFTRNYCETCKKPFWSVDSNRKVCGDASCSPGESFAFIGKSPAKHKLSYIEVWQKFSEMFKKFGYTPIKRYPVVSRWNPTMEYTNASIAAFQPYVISGEVEPPANPLVIPQFCLRFGDIDNVGVTMSHATGFIMIGQHMFVPPEKWNQNQCFRDIHAWLKNGLGLPNEEITFHEDAWAGGGNLGCCMEYFSRGCELGNQVYMLYEQTPAGVRDLKIKVLDMGMGMERNAWFSQGSNTMFDATFPTVIKKLCQQTGFKIDESLVKKYVPYAGLLNLDETEDIHAAWATVAKKTGIPVQSLQSQIFPLSGVYSIAEHTRSLLFVLSDGGLPSNVGGGYNLRMLVRRALSFIEKNKWDVELAQVCEWHAEYLKPLFPELSESLDEVQKILEVEKSKFYQLREKSRQVATKITAKGPVTTQDLLELYDSQGIQPDLVKEEAEKQGISIIIPDDFYSRVSLLHEKKEQVHATKREMDLDLHGLPGTKSLYFDDYTLIESDAKVLKIIDNKVVLDRSVCYPTSGGQVHDCGRINDSELVDAFKQGNIIVHILSQPPKFKVGDLVKVNLDSERRFQLAQHHTATHIVNAAARQVLGKHINQAGAKKTTEKAHLDITHFESLTDDELKKIESVANEIVSKKINIIKMFVPRNDAEKKYGMAIYQGGAVPGKEIRIIDIPGVDVEACGGTHLNNTSEVGTIKILKSAKIQDGIVRITFTAGKAAIAVGLGKDDIIDKIAKSLGISKELVLGRAEELFTKWKKAKKLAKQDKIENKELALNDLKLVSTAKSDGDILQKTSVVLRTPVEHLLKTIERFLSELDDAKKEIEKNNN